MTKVCSPCLAVFIFLYLSAISESCSSSPFLLSCVQQLPEATCFICEHTQERQQHYLTGAGGREITTLLAPEMKQNSHRLSCCITAALQAGLHFALLSHAEDSASVASSQAGDPHLVWVGIARTPACLHTSLPRSHFGIFFLKKHRLVTSNFNFTSFPLNPIILPLCNLFPQVLTVPPCLLASGLINELFIPYPRSLTHLFNKNKPDIWPSNT